MNINGEFCKLTRPEFSISNLKHFIYIGFWVFLLQAVDNVAFAKLDAGVNNDCEWLNADFTINEGSNYAVCAIGSRLKMFEQNDLNGVLNVSSLPLEPGVIAVGPINQLKGEITVYDGELHLSTLNSKNEQVKKDKQGVSAIFLGVGYAKNWQKVVIDKPLVNLQEIEAFVKLAAKKHSLNFENGFPFKIEGLADKLIYHVIYKHSDESPHTMKLHRQAKHKFKVPAGSNVQIAGIYVSDKDVGRITHPGKNTHLHAVIDNGSGHVDAIMLRQGAVLYIPSITLF